MAVILIVLTYIYLEKKGNSQPPSEKTEIHREKGIAPPAIEIITIPEEAIASPGQKQEGTSSLNQTDTSAKGTEPSLLADAIEGMNKGEYQKAIELFGDLSKQDKRAVLGLGITYYKAGNYDMAVRYLEESLNYNETLAGRKLLAFIYYRKDDLQKSLANAEKGLLIKNDNELRLLYEKVSGETKTEARYLEESVLHFKVLFDGYEHGGISRKVLAILEDAYSSIGSELSYFPDEPITVILYTEKDFFDITKGPEWSGGIYDGKIKIPVKGIEGAEAAIKQVLFHEYTHALIHQMTENCPVWLNEGLAQYFSGGNERVNQAIPLRKLEKSFINLSKAEVDTAYKESYSAVSYLIEKYGILDMKHLLSSLGQGKGINEAFDSAFFISYDEFVSTWGLP